MLSLLALGSALGLAGCTQGDPDETPGDGTGDGNGDTPSPTPVPEGPDVPEGDAALIGPDGREVELTLVYTARLSVYEDTAEYLNQEFSNLGINLNLETVEWSTLLGRYVANEYAGGDEAEWTSGPYNAGPRDETESAEPWDLMYGINFNTYPRTPASGSVFWHEKGSVNYYGYAPENNEELKSMWDEVEGTADYDRRLELLSQIYGQLSHDQPVNFVNFSTDTVGYRDPVVGPVEKFGTGWDFQTWHFDDPTVSGTYTAALSGDGETLIPFLAADTTSGAFISTALDGAYAVTTEDEVFPFWVDIERDSNDVYVCTLRDNLQWSDPYGQMTAEDWVYNIQEIHQGEDNWAGSIDAGDWEGVNVEETGNLEFQIELPAEDPVYPFRPDMWGTSILPKDLIQAYVEEQDIEGLQQDEEINSLGYAGNLGPYEFDHWERDGEFVATRNDDYYMQDADDVPDIWNGAPYFEQLVYRIIPEESTRLNALETGEVDSAGLPDRRVADFEEMEGVNVNSAPQPFIRILAYNQRANGWDQLRNRKVRQGLSMAVNKRVILEQIQRGLGEIAHTFQPRWSDWYVDEEVREFGVDDRYDHIRARQLIAEGTSDDYEWEAR